MIVDFDTYWRSLMRDEQPPSRDDIDLIRLKAALPNIILFDIEWQPFRAKYRLCGTTIAVIAGGDLAGHYLDAAPNLRPKQREDYLAELKIVATERRPAYARDWVKTRMGILRNCYAGLWPLAMGSNPVNMCLVIEDYLDLAPEDVMH